jgi:hypothetical protein
LLFGGVAAKQQKKRSLSCLEHHRLHQMLKGGIGIPTEAAVHRGELDDGATRGDQPVKAFRQREMLKLAGCGATGSDDGETGQVAFDVGRIRFGRKGRQSTAVERYAGLEKLQGTAEQDDAGIDELATFDTRYNSDNGIIKRVQRGH